ncbi:hypothetical protein [Methylobacterium sp. Leaf118]|uniref:hypothetical protein n=1 Tax=Methylobacterium sp. Leaf118 TaxID=2876562 RepID=UPI001E4654F5|nr:hypothetical protein [Methylobacterium sp. Leaf118]
MSMMETHLTHSGPMNPPAGPPASFEAWQALVAPGDVFRHPREVLAHPLLSPAEKRAILASWASDASALDSAPGLRCLAGCRAEPVSVDVVLGVLAELDGSAAREARPAQPVRATPRRPRRLPFPHRHVPRRRRDDDDDPPPCPAMAMPRPRIPPNVTLALALPA